MNEGILGAIANPQLADVAGALQYRKSRMDEDEAKRKELRMNQFIADAIPNLEKGSTLHQMAVDDPKTFAMFAKMRGIPLNDGEAMEKHRSTVSNLAQLAAVDPKKALDHARMLQQENIKMGVNNKPIDEWVALADKDPITAFNALYIENQSLNPVKAGEGFSLSEGQTRFDAQGNKIASVEKTYNPNAPENRPTANAQDLATYKAMKAAGDPDAEGFGRSIGIVSKEGEKLSSFAEKAIADSSDAANASRLIAGAVANSELCNGALNVAGSTPSRAKMSLAA